MYLQVKRGLKKAADKGQGQEGKRENVVMVLKLASTFIRNIMLVFPHSGLLKHHLHCLRLWRPM